MKTKAQFFISIVVLFALLTTPYASAAKNVPSFVGAWWGLDVDGGEMRLTISGPPGGPFQITWTEDYLGFCGGGAGIVRGKGTLVGGDPNLMEANLRIVCFTTGAALDFQQMFRYAGDDIAVIEGDHLMMTWHRRGDPIPAAEYAIIAHPDQALVEGIWLTEGAYVRLYIFDANHTVVWSGAQESFWEGDTFRVNFSLDYALQPGDQVWMTDGLTVDGMVVTNLAISEFDWPAQIVYGTAEPGSEVFIEYSTAEEWKFFTVLVAEDGAWSASFAGMLPDSWALVSQASTDNDLTRLAFYLSNPRFTVFPEWEWFDGMDWPDGATVTITVEGKPECTTQHESWGGFFNGSFGEFCDVMVGDSVIFSDGTSTRSHIVQNLAVTSVDEAANTVSGLADTGADVHVWAHVDGSPELVETAADGAWTADFTGQYDLYPGLSGRSQIRDERGNATAVDWYIPNPRITVYPQWERFDGMEFPVGTSVTVSVTGKPECTAVVDILDNGEFYGGFEPGCDVTAGDEVTAATGTITSTHIVDPLHITAVDYDANTVSGIANPDQLLGIWINDTDIWFEVPVDGDGNWTADFNGRYDLVPGTAGMTDVRDEQGDGTAIDWFVPNPRLVVNLTENWVWMRLFHWDADAVMDVYEYEGGPLLATVDVTTTGYDGSVWWDAPVDLVPGNFVTVSDGTTTHSIVLEALAFDQIDFSTGIATGSAPEPFGRDVWVAVGYTDVILERSVTTGSDGSWTADFGGPLPAEYWWIAAQVFDEDGDATEARPADVLGLP